MSGRHLRLHTIFSRKLRRRGFLQHHITYNDQDGEAEAIAEEAEELLETINKAVKLGYLWAKIETEREHINIVQQFQDEREKSSSAGKKGGVKRQAIARKIDAEKRPIAIELAREIIGRNLYATQVDVVYEIRSLWKSRGTGSRPNSNKITKWISEEQNSGNLPWGSRKARFRQ